MPAPAGGGSDVDARLLGEALSHEMVDIRSVAGLFAFKTGTTSLSAQAPKVQHPRTVNLLFLFQDGGIPMGYLITTITRSTGRKISLWVGLLVMTIASIAWGDPPPWAPAHGWRKKHDPNYAGYEGARWPSDYGILHGSCNREAIGVVLGGVVGGAVGSRVGEGETRAVATAIGAVIGAVIGAQVGRSMDEEDRACVGHSLELVESGRAVHWVNQATGMTYTLIPITDYTMSDRPCREFTLNVGTQAKADSSRQHACRNRDGTWILGTR